jgi:hypothetical protein
MPADNSAGNAAHMHKPTAEARQALLLMYGQLLLLHTLDVVTQHLPVAFSTTLSKTLASLQARPGKLRMETTAGDTDVLCCSA